MTSVHRPDAWTPAVAPCTVQPPLTVTQAMQAGPPLALRVARTADAVAALLRHLKQAVETLDDTASVQARGSLHVVVATPGDRATTISLDDVARSEGLAVCITGPPLATTAGQAKDAPVDGPGARAGAGAGAGADPPSAIAVEDHGTAAAVLSKRTRRDSDAAQEQDPASRKRLRPDATAHDDAVPLITSEVLDDIAAKLRADVQDDTSECLDHVQTLLGRLKAQRHEQASNAPNRRASGPLAAEHVTTPVAAFPSPGPDPRDQDIPVPDLIRQESKLISSQIKWAEDCRRVAADAHDKREENWRTSSANFHDKARQERESFQGRLLHEQGMQSQTLNQILNQVKSFGLYVQSMKWETPGSMSMAPPYLPGPPAYPTQPHAAPPRGRGRPRGSGTGV